MAKNYTPFTVAALIERLDSLPARTPLDLDARADSYRGYYNHVAVAPGASTAGALMAHLRKKVGTTMVGWKGGEYEFSPDCRVFVAEPGDTGPLLVWIDEDGTSTTAEDVCL